jgi:LPXTG-motif cell wall-anchored protein
MLTAALFVLAQGGDNTAEAPDTGIGLALIALIVVGVVLLAAALFFVFHRTTRASRGGVQRPRRDRERPTP